MLFECQLERNEKLEREDVTEVVVPNELLEGSTQFSSSKM